MSGWGGGWLQVGVRVRLVYVGCFSFLPWIMHIKEPLLLIGKRYPMWWQRVSSLTI